MSPQESELSVVVLVASVREGRIGKAIANWVTSISGASERFSLEIIDLAETDLPLKELKVGGATTAYTPLLEQADAFVVVTPEYNHSFPASLKNFIDWHYPEWGFKPVAFVSYGAHSGGIRAIEHLRGVFAELRSATIRNSVSLISPWEYMNQNGGFNASDRITSAIDAMFSELAWWASALATARKTNPFQA